MPGPGLDLIGEEELAELTEVIESGRLSRYGPDDDTFPAKVRSFEDAVAERAGVKHALARNSGTSGLYLALTALGSGPGDEGIVPGFTYVATISSVVYARARPVLAEVDQTLNLDPATKRSTPCLKHPSTSSNASAYAPSLASPPTTDPSASHSWQQDPRRASLVS